MFNRFKQQLVQHLPNHNDFLIGLSGGVDSVVLLHLFSRTKKNVRAIYIHHGLSRNADQWADFCATLCKRLKIPFVLQKVTIDKTKGIEHGARAARYRAFQQHLQAGEVLVTAHHQDDQVETFFLALKRGSGVKGLSAMQAVSFRRSFAIFRPLLIFSKAEILAYANAQQLEWVEDESNADNRYERNFLRNEILPLLNERWQQFNQMVGRSAQHCENSQALLEELLQGELERYADFNEQSLNVADFIHFSHQKQQQLIRLWLGKMQVAMPSQEQLRQIVDNLISAAADKNPNLQLGEYFIRRYQQRIFLTRALVEVPPFSAEIPPISEQTLPYRFGYIKRTQRDIFCKTQQKNYRLQLPAELAEQPVTLRIGVKGKVKQFGKPMREEMKKIWRQHNIPVWLRHCTLVIFYHEEVVTVLSR